MVWRVVPPKVANASLLLNTSYYSVISKALVS